MPSWKKVLISGSDAALNTLIVTNGITGSLFGTASWAISASIATTASYALTSSYSLNPTISGSINNVDYIDFNTGSAIPAWKSGRVYWDNTDGALSVYNAEADISLQVGQEQWVRVYNNTGALITNGTPVRLVGALGDNPLIVLAQSVTGSGTPISENQLIGVATHTIENNSIGYVTTSGLVRGLNTSAFAEGDLLYVSSSAGQYTNIVPLAPYEIIQVGIVIKDGPGGSGIIYVDVTQPVDLSDLTSVERGTYQYGDLLTYVQSGSYGVWRHTNQLSGSYGLTGSLSIVNGGITGSLFGTSSYANSASFLTSNTNAFIQGGNSFGTTALLGTNDNQSLALETNGSEKIRIDTIGNVGIGKTLPNAKLDVSGSVIISGSTTWVLPGNTGGYITPGTDGITIGNNATGAHIAIRNSNRTAFGQSVGIGNPNFNWTTFENLTIKTGGTASNYHGVIIGNGTNNSIFKVQGDGRVGINVTTTASASLHVVGLTSSSLSSSLLVQNSNTSASFIVRDDGSIGAGIAAPIYRFQINTPVGTDQFAVTNGGSSIRLAANIGLGNPGIVSSGIIHIGSPLNGTGGTEVLQVRKAGGANFIQYWSSNAGVTLSAVDGTGRLGIGTGTTPLSASLHISGANSTALLRVDSSTTSGSFFVSGSGNVGIGTTTPNATLDVSGSAIISGSLTVTNGITGSLFGTSSWAVSSSWAPYQVSSSYAETASFAPLYLPLTGGTIDGNVTVNGTASIAFLNVLYESASVIYSSGSNVFGDATDDTQTLNGTVLVSGSQQITGSLNVSAGITGSLFGTSSFAVSSSRAVTSSFALTSSFLNGGTNGFIQNGNSFGTTALVGTNDNQAFAFETSGSERMRITSAGNVGIGTTSPYSRFTTLGALSTSTSQISIVNSEGGHTILRTGISGITNSGFSLISADVAGTNQNTRLVVSSAGNVGIGTTSPLGKLQVNEYTVAAQGGQATTGQLNVFADSGTESLFLGIRNAAYPNRGWAFNPITNGVNSNLQIREHGFTGVRMTIASGGNVGIGTTAPNAKLDVSGSAIISGSFTVTPGTVREFQVNTTGVDIGNLITDAHTVTGSLSVSGSVTATSFTGSLFGTASWAQNALTASNITPAITNNTDNYVLTANGDGTINGESLLQFDGQKLSVLYQAGDEGGEILLGKPATNTSLTGSGVTIDIWQNRLRFFEQGGAARGAYIDLTAAAAGVGTNLIATSGGGTVTSVGGTGNVNGITLTGTVTTSGSLTLGGTLSNIQSSQLATSSLMIGTTNIALGATGSSLAGLTSVTATSFTGSLQGTSSYATQALSASWAPTVSTFPYTGSALITGSLGITGSFSTTRDILVNGITVGRGGGNLSGSTVLGFNAAGKNITGVDNTVIGYNAMSSSTLSSNNTVIGKQAMELSTSPYGSVAIGLNAMRNGSMGGNDVAVGNEALMNYSNATNNVAIGGGALRDMTANGNTAVGIDAGRYISNGGNNTGGNNSVYLGYNTRPSGNSETNEIVIGQNAIGLGNNTTTIGNSSTLSTALYGDLLLGQTIDNGTDKLQVTGTSNLNGNTRITGSLRVTQGITGSLFGTSSWAISALTSSYSTNIAGVTNYIAKFTGANTLSSSLIFDNGTAVMVGTTTPAARLTVTSAGTGTGINGTAIYAYSNGGPTIEAGAANSSSIVATNNSVNSSTLVAQNIGSGPIFSLKNNTDAIVVHVLNNGSVGVGTITPTLGKLQVSGNVHATSFTGSLFGTSSWAVSASWAPATTTAATASFVTASNVYGPFGSSSILSSSFAVSASNAVNVSSIANNVASNTNNYLLTATGGSTIQGESSLQFDGTLLKLVGSLEQGNSNADAQGTETHAEGRDTIAQGAHSHTEGRSTISVGAASHAEGFTTKTQGIYSHAEGYLTTSSGDWSHAEGESTSTSGTGSHAEGNGTIASGNYSHAEGVSTQAQAQGSHAEGSGTKAQGISSHAEGYNTLTWGLYSHAEGYFTSASGNWSHAEGELTKAIGNNSHAEGLGTVSLGAYQHTQGQYNISSSAQSAFIIGNGTADGSRSNLVFASGSQVQITGSLEVTQGITGSLFGTASIVSSIANNVLNNTNNYILTATGGGDINGESNLTFDGADLLAEANIVAGQLSNLTTTYTITDGVSSILTKLNAWDAYYATGEILSDELSDVALVAGEIVVMQANRKWALADATAADAKSTHLLGVTLTSTSGADEAINVLLNGFVSKANVGDPATVVEGAPLYLSTSVGKIFETAPVNTGEVVRVVGHTFWNETNQSNSTVIIRFNPDNTWIEL